MLMHATGFDTKPKKDWRDFVYSILTPQNCRKLVDGDGNFLYRWLEPCGDLALPFKQLLSTGRISESKLIGIDLDPKNIQHSKENIKQCRLLFPQAEFHDKEWGSFCRRCNDDDIGYIIFDFYNAAHGNALKRMLEPTINLVDRSKKSIGEVLLVVNNDIKVSKKQNGDFNASDYATQIEDVLKMSSIASIRSTIINPKSIYTYKNKSNGDDMATFAMVL